jgi:hypothetical protein
MAIGVAALERLLGRIGARLDQRSAEEVGRLLGVDGSVVRSGRISVPVGLDPAGTVQIAMAPLDAAASRDVAALHALADSIEGHADDATRGDSVAQALDAPREHLLAIRGIAPVRDPGHVIQVGETYLTHIGWTRVDPPDGVAELLVSPDSKAALAVSRGTDMLVLDLVIAPFAPISSHPSSAFVERVRGAVDSLRRQTTESPHGEPLAIENDALRLEIDPTALASANVLLGTAMVRTALAGVNPEMRRQIGAVGLHEVNQSLFLVRNERGAFFDRISLGVRDDLSLAIRADIGPAASIAADAAWAPSVSITQPGGVAQLDVATNFVRAWQLPGDTQDANAEGRFIVSAREAGGLALGFAFPYFLVSALRHSLYETPHPFPRPPISLERFERVSSVTRHDPDEVFVGLFPANVNANDAGCVLVAASERCTAATRLPLGRTVSRESHAVRLTRVGNRLALLVASTPPILEAANVRLTAAPVPPARFVIDLAGFSPGDPVAALFPGTFDGAVAHEGSQLVFTVTPRAP